MFMATTVHAKQTNKHTATTKQTSKRLSLAWVLTSLEYQLEEIVTP